MFNFFTRNVFSKEIMEQQTKVAWGSLDGDLECVLCIAIKDVLLDQCPSCLWGRAAFELLNSFTSCLHTQGTCSG